MKNEKLTYREAYRLYKAKHRLSIPVSSFGAMMIVVVCNGLGKLIGMKPIYLITALTGVVYLIHVIYNTWRIWKDFNLSVKDK